MASGESGEPFRRLETLRAHTTRRAEGLGAIEDRVDLGIRVAVVDVDVVGEDRDAAVLELLPDAAVVFERATEPPRAYLLARGLRSDAGSGELRLHPGRVQFDHAEPVLHEAPEQLGAVAWIHRQIVITEWLQSELHAADGGAIGRGSQPGRRQRRDSREPGERQPAEVTPCHAERCLVRHRFTPSMRKRAAPLCTVLYA